MSAKQERKKREKWKKGRTDHFVEMALNTVQVMLQHSNGHQFYIPSSILSRWIPQFSKNSIKLNRLPKKIKTRAKLNFCFHRKTNVLREKFIHHQSTIKFLNCSNSKIGFLCKNRKCTLQNSHTHATTHNERKEKRE